MFVFFSPSRPFLSRNKRLPATTPKIFFYLHISGSASSYLRDLPGHFLSLLVCGSTSLFKEPTHPTVRISTPSSRIPFLQYYTHTQLIPDNFLEQFLSQWVSLSVAGASVFLSRNFTTCPVLPSNSKGLSVGQGRLRDVPYSPLTLKNFHVLNRLHLPNRLRPLFRISTAFGDCVKSTPLLLIFE